MNMNKKNIVLLVTSFIILVILAPIFIYNSITYSNDDDYITSGEVFAIVKHLKDYGTSIISSLDSSTLSIPLVEREYKEIFLQQIIDKVKNSTTLNNIWFMFYLDGKQIIKFEVKEEDLLTSIQSAKAELKKRILSSSQPLTNNDFIKSRLKIDFIIEKKKVPNLIKPLLDISFIPGLDAIEVEYENRSIMILPDDVVLNNIQGLRPIKHKLFGIGVDTNSIDSFITANAKRFNLEKGSKPIAYYRCKTRSYIETFYHKSVKPVYRCNIIKRDCSKSDVYNSIVSASRWFTRNVDYNLGGRINYIYNCLDGTIDNNNYSYPRHAGSTYGMYKMYSVTKDAQLFEAANKALSYILQYKKKITLDNNPNNLSPIYVISPDDFAKLGNTSLTLLALLEYASVTKDRKYDDLISGLGNYLLLMQTTNGDFNPYYNLSSKEKHPFTMVLNFNGQAILALTRLYHYMPSELIKEALQKSFDFVQNKQWDFFLGSLYRYFFFWEVQAIAEANDIFGDRYNDIVDKIANDALNSIMTEDNAPFDDFVGTIDQSMFLLPNSSGCGIYLEGLASYFKLVDKNDKRYESVKKKIKVLAEFIISLQVDIDNAYLHKKPLDGIGGIRYSGLKPILRNDYTQHCIVGIISCYQNGIFE